jgi:SsrA-binding protein
MTKENAAEGKVVATNRKAYHDYFIEEKYEAGIMLQGTEVKSLREGRVNLQDSYASVRGTEVYLHQCHISPYSHGNIMNHDPTRVRRLLLHKVEINKLLGKTQQKGLTPKEKSSMTAENRSKLVKPAGKCNEPSKKENRSSA